MASNSRRRSSFRAMLQLFHARGITAVQTLIKNLVFLTRFPRLSSAFFASSAVQIFSVFSAFLHRLIFDIGFQTIRVNSAVIRVNSRLAFSPCLRASVPPWLIFDFPHLPSAYSLPLFWK